MGVPVSMQKLLAQLEVPIALSSGPTSTHPIVVLTTDFDEGWPEPLFTAIIVISFNNLIYVIVLFIKTLALNP